MKQYSVVSQIPSHLQDVDSEYFDIGGGGTGGVCRILSRRVTRSALYF